VRLRSFGTLLAAMLIAAPALASAPTIGSALDAIAARPAFTHALVAGEVYDLDAKRPIYARNAGVLMEAASTTKILTTGTSLALLGPSFRWTTPVYRTGPVDSNGVLHGDLVLVAGGDPNLSQRIGPNDTLAFENEDHSYDGNYDTRAVPGDPLAILRQLAQQVSRAGIKEIDGRIVIDTSLFPDAEPESGTGVIPSPIVVNDNLVDVTVTPGSSAGDPVSISVSPQTPYVTFANAAKTGAARSEPTIDLSNDKTNSDGSHTVTMTGAIPAGKPILFSYRVPDPQRFAQAAFGLALHDTAIRLNTPANASAFNRAAAAASFVPANLVAQHVSPPLSQDVYLTLKVSDNLHAALMPYMWAIYVAHAKENFLKAGFARERGLLAGAGLDLRGASQQDGLGGFAFFTPRFMVSFLAWAARQTWYPALYRGLPVLAVDGTLFNIQNGSPAAGKVHAKTGTWGSANLLDDNGLVTKGLAGYMTTSHGRHVAFAFYINRMAGKPSLDTSKDSAHYAGQTLGEMASDVYRLF
jgi:PBP4 family serine-type D-alanyl-D-alanine carboxypeptidase